MLFSRTTYLIKEHVGLMKLTQNYDILDAATGQQIGIAREEPGDLIKYIRIVLGKRWLPTTVNFYESDGGRALLSIHRGVRLLRARVTVSKEGQFLGTFQAKVFSIGGAFRVLDAQERDVALIKGDWKGWNFVMTSASGEELGRVTKKWAGIGKELFTTADNYVVSLAPRAAGDPTVGPLLLAAGVAIDTVFKEDND
jgi:uncharacterized protein YxjI